MLQKLVLKGALTKLHIDYLFSGAPFQVAVVDLQTDTPLSNVYVNNIVPLLSIMREVTFRG
jgi:hypothetical protein